MRVVLLIAVLLLSALPVEAANHYIRDGATGSAPCSDWSAGNACDVLPATLTRGDTYYIADGSYVAYTFDDAASANQLITIKKATVADHGTETGWDNGYGDGQAIWSSPLTFSTDDWVFDGVSRDESDVPVSWFTGSAYGFKIQNNANAAQRQVILGAALDNLTIRYTWFEGKSGAFSGAERRYSVDCETAGESTNLLFSRNLSTDSNQWYFLRGTRGAVIEYWAGDRLTGDGNNHGDAINGYFTAEDFTVRWGIARDACTEGCTGMIPIADWKVGQGFDGEKPKARIYGNVFYDYGGSDGTVGFTGSGSSDGNCTDCAIFNNTFVNGNAVYDFAWGIQAPQGSGNIHRNNIYFSDTSTFPNFDLGSSSTNTHNAFGTFSSSTGTSAITSLTTGAFTNYANRDLRLAAALSSCGVSMPSPYDVDPYNKDLLGNTRGADGCWDRGAFEFVAGGGGGSSHAISGSVALSGGVVMQ